MVPIDLVNVLHSAVRRAGEAVLAKAAGGFETGYKEGQDPVTEADLEADRLLKETLLGSFPEYGWLSEETRKTTDRLTRKRVWIVDPIDGTKEFVQGIPEYAISVALVEDGLPIAAAVYNPATDELFSAARDSGALINGQSMLVAEPGQGSLVLLASRSETKRGEFIPFEAYTKVQPVGSIAYKLALVAQGRAHATFSLGPKNEWDIAAGVLLIEEAGGRVSDQNGRPFVFNQPNTLVDGIVAASDAAYQRVMELIQAHRGGA